MCNCCSNSSASCSLALLLVQSASEATYNRKLISLGPAFDSHVLKYVIERICKTVAMLLLHSQYTHQLSILAAHIVNGDSNAVNNEVVHALISGRCASAYDVLLARHIVAVAETLQVYLSIKLLLHRHAYLESIVAEKMLGAIRQHIALANKRSYALIFQQLSNQIGDVLHRCVDACRRLKFCTSKPL